MGRRGAGAHHLHLRDDHGAPGRRAHTAEHRRERRRRAPSDLAGITPDARVLGTALHLVMPALLAGAAAVLPPRRVSALARTTRDRAVTHLTLAPGRAVDWVAAGGVPPGLRGLFLGTAPLRNAALRRILPGLPVGARPWGIYGMTEMLLVAAVEGEERLAHDERDGDLVGTAFPGTGIRVAEDGEVHVSGPGLARGYLGGPAVTEIGSGDVGRLDDGRLLLLGRRKEMLIRRGENIYPGLYEPALIKRAWRTQRSWASGPAGRRARRALDRPGRR